MKALLRILFIEDSEEDTCLAIEDLRRAGFYPTYERVETPQALSEALTKSWDVVISDYSMPSFRGNQAFEMFKRTGLDIPFISFSGTIGEKVAVSMMKAGVHDYVMKDDRNRLAPAIERELKSAAARREKQHAQVAAAHLAAIVESSDDAIISETLDGMILTWNRGAETTYGYKAAEMIGRPISILVPPTRLNELRSILAQVKNGEKVRQIETVRTRRDGGEVEVSITVSPIKDANGQIIGVSSIARDIGDRRREEAERLKLISDLTSALAHANTLRGLLPICSSCKRIRDDSGYWEQVEVYIQKHSNADFTHGICPECAGRLYPEFIDKICPHGPGDEPKAA